MSLPDPEDIVYRGINTGDSKSMAYRGFLFFIRGPLLKVVSFTVTVTKAIHATITKSIS